MDRPDVEILVHITAPAQAVDDTRYRALAAAYLGFEPATRTSIAIATPKNGKNRAGYGAEGLSRSTLVHDISVSQPAPDPGVIQSPLLSFRSAVNNFDSPRLKQPESFHITETQSSWQPPPSVVDDSMPDNDLVFRQYCTPTRLLAHYTSTYGSSQVTTSPISRQKQSQLLPVSGRLQSRNSSPPFAGTASYRQHEVHEHGEAVIPLSPGTDGRRHRPTTPSPDMPEETRIASSYPSQPSEPASSARAESEPPLSKRPRTSRDPEPSKPLVRSASDIGPRQGKKSACSSFPQISDALEILSPPPLTGQRELRPEDMITDILARLARELDLEKRYKPESQTRHLRPFERGYWLLDCSSWEPELKRSAWGFLSDYLGKGAAGWGTSCKRDREFSWIRLYCWGCVVGHMYLLLYLMSKRRVLYTGASWIGADERAVVVMRARPGPA
ncbi:hypothetical protein VTI74DRAFT_10920 [Chaetomium olivicolor]